MSKGQVIASLIYERKNVQDAIGIYKSSELASGAEAE